MEQQHDHHHDHHHGQHGHHRQLWLAADPSRSSRIHRVGRRQFLTELGRNTFAIAVLGGLVAACSSDDDAAPDAAEAGSNSAAPTTTATVADAPPPTEGPAATEAPTDTAPASDASAGDELRWAQASLGNVSAYVLVRGNEAAVVDTGNPGSADQIGAALATLNATYDDVRHVVLTHSHPDHIGSLADVLDRSQSAIAYAGGADIPNISAPREVTAVGDGDDVFGLQVIDTPGHTPGSISVFDPGIGLLVAGDALNGNDDGSGLSGPNERFTPDMTTANQSVGKLAQLEVDAVAMGHGQPVPTAAGDLLTALAATL